MDNFLDKSVIAVAPPPPLEVKIRTMRSDIDSMMKSGGGAPIFQDIAVSGLSMEKEYIPPPFANTPMPSRASPEQAPVATPQIQIEEQRFPAPVVRIPESEPIPEAEPVAQPAVEEEVPAAGGAGSTIAPIIIVTLVALLAIGVVGYFVYTLFLK